MKEELEIYLNNGGYIAIENTQENKEQLFEAIDMGINWITIDGVTLNISQITYFRSTAQEAQGGTEK